MKYRIQRYVTTEGQYREYRYLAPAKKKKAAVTPTAEMAGFSRVAGIPAAADRFGVSTYVITKARKIFQKSALQA
jgi:hypothetical protein